MDRLGRAPASTYLALGLARRPGAASAAVAPPLLIEAVAGLALIGALGAALAGRARRTTSSARPAIITFVVSASAVTVLGISAPFWGLLAGLAVLGVQRAGAVPGRAARELV